MAIKSKNFNKKLARAKRRSDFWFKLRKLGFMRRILIMILKQATANNNFNDVNKLQVFPSDFRKLSNEQIERGLDMFVARGELATWSHIKEQNADGYLVVFPDENHLESRIFNRIPQEIDLNNIQLAPIYDKEQQIAAEPEQTQNEDNPPVQLVESANDYEEDYSKPF